MGLWIAWRRRNPLILALAWLAVSSAIPPIFFDWGYRSTDFLRFFTASYCFAALFLGWLTGELLAQPGGRRLLGGLLVLCCLVNPIGLGIVGLVPGTITKVKSIASTAQSLSQTAEPLPSDTESARHAAFEKLALTTGDYLFHSPRDAGASS